MPSYELSVSVISLELDNGLWLVESVLPEGFSGCHDEPEKAREYVRVLCGNALGEMEPAALAPQLFGGDIRHATAELEVKPAKRLAAWQEPVALTFHYAWWEREDGSAVAYVPILGITVLAEKADWLPKRVVNHTTFALFRTGQAGSLGPLTRWQGVKRGQVDRLTVNVDVPTPKNRLAEHKKRLDELTREEDTSLEDAAEPLSVSHQPAAFEVDGVMERLSDALGGRHPCSVLLVGPSGVGKTAAVHELVRRHRKLALGFRSYWTTSGSRLVAGMSGFGMWQARCKQICERVARDKVLLHVGNLFELMEVGKSTHSAVSIAAFLRPYIARGDIHVVAECTPQEIPLIEKAEPHLLELLTQVEMPEPDAAAGRRILRSVAERTQAGPRRPISAPALATLDRLHRRYATYSAYPGRPLRFLENLQRDLPGDKVATAQDVTRAFSHETGLPLAILDDHEPLDLEATAAWFRERVHGQTAAVELVVDLLAVIKTRLARPRKPLASLLFAGPTGVGKTEMAKTLAEFLFGDRTRMVRFDMSEFADPVRVRRLIGGGEEGEGQLTARVREQPFCVLLLDEFEKAHPDVYDLLLQVLGEGRLTDTKGRVADFCNAVIIMTSNLGAKSFEKGRLGFVQGGDARANAREHFAAAVRKFLRPEMYNRIDGLVPFAPLDRQTVRQIAARELDIVTRRDGVTHRRVALTVDADVADYFADVGFDARYGARPLKRAIEEQMVVPLAERLNAYSDETALCAHVSAPGGNLAVQVGRAEGGKKGGAESSAEARESIMKLAEDCVQVRRMAEKVSRSAQVTAVRNEVFRQNRQIARGRRALPASAAIRMAQQLVAGHEAFIERVGGLVESATRQEEDFLLGYYARKPPDTHRVRSELDRVRRELNKLSREVYAAQFAQAHVVVLAVFGESPDQLFGLASAYHAVAMALPKAAVEVYRLVPRTDAGGKQRVLDRAAVKKPGPFLGKPVEGCVGIALEIQGEMAFPALEPEKGWHIFEIKKKRRRKVRCYVDTAAAPLALYQPPAGADRPGGIKETAIRRTYDLGGDFVTDHVLGKKYPWPGDLPETIDEFAGEHLERQIADVWA